MNENEKQKACTTFWKNAKKKVGVLRLPSVSKLQFSLLGFALLSRLGRMKGVRVCQEGRVHVFE